MVDRSLRPEKLDIDSSDPECGKKWAHWKRCFKTYISSINTPEKPVNQLDYLIGLVSHSLYEHIEDSASYDAAETTLGNLFQKKINVLYARHLLLTRKQKEGETITDFISALKSLSKDCSFEAVDATQHKEAYIRDAFVTGLTNKDTKRKILESKETQLGEIITLAQIYEDAKSNAECFSTPSNFSCSIGETLPSESVEESFQTTAAMKKYHSKAVPCGWCGGERHPKFRCPAKDSKCSKCSGHGHWAKVCRRTNSTTRFPSSSSVFPVLASVSNTVPKCLEQSVTVIGINGRDCNALWDTGSAQNYMAPSAAKSRGLKIIPEHGEVAMADTDNHTVTSGYVKVTLTVNGKKYPNSKLTLLPNACVDVILGIEFLNQHQNITIKYGGNKPPLVSSLGTLKVEPPDLFAHLTADCHPIASKSRRYSAPDRAFIKSEVARLLREGIIEKSNSPWRSQPYVTGGGKPEEKTGC